MSSISSSLVLTRTSGAFSSGSARESSDQFLGAGHSTNLSFKPIQAGKLQRCSTRRLTVQAAYSEGGGGRPSSASVFVGGFVLGGIIVGAIGCVFAPQISRALAKTDRKELMRKLPKFIYDEEKALEKTRKVLTEKIAQLNSAIDEVSAQLRSEDSPNDVSKDPDEVEAAI